MTIELARIVYAYVDASALQSSINICRPIQLKTNQWFRTSDKQISTNPNKTGDYR
jgi:hypothetical protein